MDRTYQISVSRVSIAEFCITAGALCGGILATWAIVAKFISLRNGVREKKRSSSSPIAALSTIEGIVAYGPGFLFGRSERNLKW